MGRSTISTTAPAKLTLNNFFVQFYSEDTQKYITDLQLKAYLLGHYSDFKLIKEDIYKEDFDIDLKNWTHEGIQEIEGIFAEMFVKNNRIVHLFNEAQYAGGGEECSIIAIAKDSKSLESFKQDFEFNESFNIIEHNITVSQTA